MARCLGDHQGRRVSGAWLTSKKRYEDLSNMWLDRANQVVDEDRQRIALDHWLSTLLARLPKAKVPGQIDKVAKLLGAGKLAHCQRVAKINLIAAAMLTSPITLAEAEDITACKLPNHELQQPPGDQSLLSAILLLDAVYRLDGQAARGASQTLELAQLTSTVNLAWCKAVALAAEELPATQLAQWVSVFEAVRMPDAGATPSTPVLQMTRLRLEQLRQGSGRQAEILDKIKQLAEANATDPGLQLTWAAAIFQSADDASQADERFAEAMRIVKRVALGTKKDSEAHLRSRWLEARWQAGRGNQAAAAQVAQLMLSSTTIQQPSWKSRFERIMVPKGASPGSPK